MRDMSRRGHALTRAIELGTGELTQSLDGMIEHVSVTSTSGAAGEVPRTTADDDSIEVLEPYGFSSAPPGAATALVVAPGGETQERVAIGVSSPGGRPTTDAGDSVMWTAAGHSVLLDDSGGIVVTSKDGSSIDMADTGAITINAKAGANVTVNVSVGSFVNLGGAGAALLALGQKVIDGVDAMLLAGTPVLNDGGANLLLTMTNAWNIVKSAILATKARGE